MGQTLKQIAENLKKRENKVQLIYAFNGTGKTRLSREFKELVAPKESRIEDEDNTPIKILYYNAFTEDLFYWDNTAADKILKIQPNSFTDWVLRVQGQDSNIIKVFQQLTNEKLTPKFSEDYSEIRFSFERGNAESSENIKISKGEESCFVWSVFFSLMKQVVNVLNIPDPKERETDQYDDLEYVFIDDPVSSLDDNHLIELAVNLAMLIKNSNHLKFIISTHNALFYNVLYNELDLNNKKKKKDCCFMLDKFDDGTFEIETKFGDSNKCFSYHLHLKQILEDAIKTSTVQKYHFTLLRNLYEKTANFLGYPKWSVLLPDDKEIYYNRVIQFTSHSTLSNEVVPEPTEPEKKTLSLLFYHLVNGRYWKEEIEATAPAIAEA